MNTERNHYDEMFDDLHHLLRWLAMGQMLVAILQTVEAITAITEGRWVAGGIHAVIAVALYVAMYRTETRAIAYQEALRWWAAQRAKNEDQAAMSISAEGELPLPAEWAKALDDVSRRGKGRRV